MCVGQWAQFDPVQMWVTFVPIVRVALKHHPVARSPRFQNEWACTYRMPVVILSELLSGGWRVDDVVGKRDRKRRREFYEWIAKIEDDS